MIYEVRTYTLRPGTVAEFEERYAKRLPSREKHSKLGAFWQQFSFLNSSWIGRQRDLQPLEHEVEQMVPALKQEIARQGLQVLKKGVSGRQGLAHQLVLWLHPPQHRMAQKGSEIQRE